MRSPLRIFFSSLRDIVFDRELRLEDELSQGAIDHLLFNFYVMVFRTLHGVDHKNSGVTQKSPCLLFLSDNQ